MREPLRKDEDAIELTIAADYFLIDSMKDVCIAAIRSTVTEENVWSFLKRLSVVKLFDVAAGCYKVNRKYSLWVMIFIKLILVA